MSLTAPVVSFRPIQEGDEVYLKALYASTREQEFAHTGWAPEAVKDFLGRQFDAQSLSYKTSFPGAVFTIIQLDGVDVGRLTIDRQDQCLRIIDLIIAPQWRGQGLGTNLLRSLMNEAHGGKVPVRLSVFKQSPALALYLRHGFKVTGDLGGYYAMEWQPDTGPREI